ncbi:hypothetical protein [Eggerthella sp. YY7918]|uniref:hypothetical protein n=1 Tax=Eggerthella sp. (strain YY7918) TaxID=502558 RepID=UPI000217129E|nr:hypothetical protein [Eggerthella sp. YY7918]BAK45834.1 hypothetical protein EGYY_28570 [Eggerthella sp. YY7918]
MGIFPTSHVCPLATEQNEFRCTDLAGKPDDSCELCRMSLRNEIGTAMVEGNTAFTAMLLANHILIAEGFVMTRGEEGDIQLQRSQGKRVERPGDCDIEAFSFGAEKGFRLLIIIDSNTEKTEEFSSMEDAIQGYFNNKSFIADLAQGDQ